MARGAGSLVFTIIFGVRLSSFRPPPSANVIDPFGPPKYPFAS